MGSITKNSGGLDPRKFDENEIQEYNDLISFVDKKVKNDNLKQNIKKKLERAKRNPKFRRMTSWRWRINSKSDIQNFVDILKEYSAIKKPQLQKAHEIMNNLKNLTEEDKQNIKENFTEMKTLNNYQAVEIDPNLITIAYIAGIFDSEGCIMIDIGTGASRFKIAQKSSPLLLFEIYRKLGYGNIDRDGLILEFHHKKMNFQFAHF